jgi:hypothetical protein
VQSCSSLQPPTTHSLTHSLVQRDAQTVILSRSTSPNTTPFVDSIKPLLCMVACHITNTEHTCTSTSQLFSNLPSLTHSLVHREARTLHLSPRIDLSCNHALIDDFTSLRCMLALQAPHKHCARHFNATHGVHVARARHTHRRRLLHTPVHTTHLKQLTTSRALATTVSDTPATTRSCSSGIDCGRRPEECCNGGRHGCGCQARLRVHAG